MLDQPLAEGDEQIVAGVKVLVEIAFRQTGSRTDVIDGDRSARSLGECAEARVKEGMAALPHSVRCADASERPGHDGTG